MAQPPQKPGGKGVPFRTLEQKDEAASRLQDNVAEALNRLGTQTLDDTADGKTYRKLVGVNFDHKLTASGIAVGAVLAPNILTVSGTSLLPATVPVSALASCDQLNVYQATLKTATIAAGVYQTLYGDSVVKDTGGGWSATNGWYSLPSNGDYWFSWAMATAACVTDARPFLTGLVINSGQVDGNWTYSSAAGQHIGSVGSYLYVNGRAGDKVKVHFFNGDSSAVALAVGSGVNFLTGFRVR